MDAKFSPRVRAILSLSHQEAQRLGNAYVGLEHLFFGYVEGRRQQRHQDFGEPQPEHRSILEETGSLGAHRY